MSCRPIVATFVILAAASLAAVTSADDANRQATHLTPLAQRIVDIRAKTAEFNETQAVQTTIRLAAGYDDPTDGSTTSSRRSLAKTSSRSATIPSSRKQGVRGYRSPRGSTTEARPGTLPHKLGALRDSISETMAPDHSLQQAAHNGSTKRYGYRRAVARPGVLSPGDRTARPRPQAAPRYTSTPPKRAPYRRPVSVAQRQPEVAIGKPAPLNQTREEPSMAQAPNQPAQTSPETENVLLSLPGPQLSAVANGPRRIVINREAEYKVTIRNTGEVAAGNVVVSIELPPWVDLANSTASIGTAQQAETQDEAGNRRVQWQMRQLPTQGSENLVLEVIPRQSKPVHLAVKWNYESTGSQAEVVVEEPLLHMVISGPSEATYGDTKLYNLTLSNPGTGDAEDVMLNLLPLGGEEDGKISHRVGTLKRGETRTIQVELAAGKAGTLSVEAQATAAGKLEANAVKEVLVRRADLKLDIQGARAQYAGNPATYRVHLSNQGNAPADEVEVSATLPAGAELVNTTGGGQLSDGHGAVRWSLGSLPAGAERSFEMVCVLKQAGANSVNVVAREATDLSVNSVAQTRVIARADLKLYVSDPKGPVPVGEEAEYQIRIVNRGTKRADNVEAIAYFSEGIEPSHVTGGDHDLETGQVMFKPVGSLAAGGELVYTIKAIADQAGNHVFRAEVICRSLGTKLAAEETSHFYDSNLQDSDTIGTVPASISQQPTPAAEYDAQATRPVPTATATDRE